MTYKQTIFLCTMYILKMQDKSFRIQIVGSCLVQGINRHFQNEQGRQCNRNITLRRVLATIVVVEKK